MFKSSDLTITNIWLATKEQAHREAAASLQEITGMVIAKNERGDILNRGSCFFFTKRYFLLTAWHVVKDATTFEINFSQVKRLEAKLLRGDKVYDLALLEIVGFENSPDHNLPFMQLAAEVIPGDVIYCAGFVDGQYQCTEGVLTHSTDIDTLVGTCISDHGTSGGPVCGRFFRKLVGVVRSDYGVVHHRTALIPPWNIKYFLQADINGPQIEKLDY